MTDRTKKTKRLRKEYSNPNINLECDLVQVEVFTPRVVAHQGRDEASWDRLDQVRTSRKLGRISLLHVEHC